MTTRERYEGLQTVLEQGGKYGCLFLCLCSIIEEYTGREIDIIDVIRISQAHGWLGHDFYCSNQLAFLKHFTNKDWTRKEVEPLQLGIVRDNEYTVAKWQYGDKVHFRRRAYDVYKNSSVCRNGELVAYYVYRVCD